MRCQLCSYDFDETQLTCHSSCAFNRHCAVICCPNCGYQTTDTSKSSLAQAFRKILQRKQASRPHPVNGVRQLSALDPGQTAKIVALKSLNATRLERLNVFGLAPGMPITLEQRHPAFVLRVGFTELSVDREIADEILVQPLSTG